jgi:hypothetical protein
MTSQLNTSLGQLYSPADLTQTPQQFTSRVSLHPSNGAALLTVVIIDLCFVWAIGALKCNFAVRAVTTHTFAAAAAACISFLPFSSTCSDQSRARRAGMWQALLFSRSHRF